MESETIEMAALGRPLHPGMLYDCRKDSFIPGVTLWDKKLLVEVDTHSQLHTDLKLSSADSLSDKCSLLNVSASLKASFMSGMVEVGGSAKYLYDNKSSNQQSRVTMYYQETTRFEQLTMSQLGHITYPQVFDQKTATHVITSVLYGAQAFMVFDRTFSHDDNKQKIEGELNVMVKKMSSFSIDGTGAVEMKEDEIKKAEDISCTFHGDFHVGHLPTTYMEALDVYKKLPTLLKEYPQNVIPIKVCLYPLSLLNEKAARLEREISTIRVSNIETVMNELEGIQRRYNDLFRNTLVHVFHDIKERLCTFQSSFSIYKLVLEKELGRVLPAIRGGENEQSLKEILKIHNESPFCANRLNQWLDDTESELNLLSSYTKSVNGIKIKDSNGLKTILLNPDIDVVVCLALTCLKYEDPYLLTLNAFLKSGFKEQDEKKALPSFPKWFKKPDIVAKMRENLSNFKRFSQANKDKTRMCFTISAISDPSSPGSSIYLYEQGNLMNKQFQPSTPKPPQPIVRSVNANTVSMILQPLSEETVQFRVEYKEVKLKEKEKEEWLVKNTTDENFTLTALESGKQYLICYRIVGKMAMSEASDTVSVQLSPGYPVIVGRKGSGK
ncbi:stonustoxin subunit alpha-like [Paramisgurnus dabryanus]|uniref:stonustoxin subunit alpha-like n=1 Tax=Paramisgurnus dabryanus TaxID=90735 RepID=UPI0031F41718